MSHTGDRSASASEEEEKETDEIVERPGMTVTGLTAPQRLTVAELNADEWDHPTRDGPPSSANKAAATSA